MVDKETKRKIREVLEASAYYETGLKWVNGGYAEVEELKVRNNKKRKVYICSGVLISGEQDCGDGHSRENRDVFENIEVNYSTVERIT